MSNQNESQLHEDLKHYVWAQLTDEELNEYTLEQLRETFRDLEQTNWQISAAYSNKKLMFDLQKQVADELRVSLAEWRYVARCLWSKSGALVLVANAVMLNIEKYKGFTHHMKDVVNTLNKDMLSEAVDDMAKPITNIRLLAEKDGVDHDIPF